MVLIVDGRPMHTTPIGSDSSVRISSWVRARSSRIARARCISRCPASVGVTPDLLRSSSWVPNSASMFLTCSDKAGCATFNCAAARVIEPSSAMARK